MQCLDDCGAAARYAADARPVRITRSRKNSQWWVARSRESAISSLARTSSSPIRMYAPGAWLRSLAEGGRESSGSSPSRGHRTAHCRRRRLPIEERRQESALDARSLLRHDVARDWRPPSAECVGQKLTHTPVALAKRSYRTPSAAAQRSSELGAAVSAHRSAGVSDVRIVIRDELRCPNVGK